MDRGQVAHSFRGTVDRGQVDMLEEQWIEGKWTCLRNSGLRVSGHVRGTVD